MLDTKKEGATSDHPLNSIHGRTKLDKSDAIFSAIEKDFEDVAKEPPTKSVPINEGTFIKFFPEGPTKRHLETLVSLGDFIADCSGEFPDWRVLECRRLQGPERKAYKERTVPCVQFQQTPNDLLLPLLPIDYEQSTVEIPGVCIFMRFKSVGGHGECIVLRLPDEVAKSKDAWEKYAKRAEKYLNIQSNKGQTSIDRMRFISHDENFYVNWMAEPFVVPEEIAEEKQQPNNGTQNGSEFNLDGLLPLDNNGAIKAFSHFRGKNLPLDEVKAILLRLPRQSESLKADHDFLQYIEQWEKRYWKDRDNTHEQGTDADLVRYNNRTHSLTVSGDNISTKQLHDMWWSTPRDAKGRRIGYDLYYHELIAKAPIWDPYEEFFSVPWTGVDQFDILKGFIKTQSPDNFVHHLRKHITRGINQLFTKPNEKHHAINRYMFVLQSHPHAGKSTFLRKVTLRGILPGFSSEFDLNAPNSAETLKLMCQCVNLINEEIDIATLNDLKNLKPLISYSGGAIRLPYDKTPTAFNRLATLWASVNPSNFISEVADRWIVFELQGLDYDYIDAVDFQDLWRQCYHYWQKDPLCGELTTKERQEISSEAEAFRSVPSLEQYLGDYFKGDVDAVPMTLEDFRYFLSDTHHRQTNDKAIGAALTNLFKDYKIRILRDGKKWTYYRVRQARMKPQPGQHT